MSKEIEIRDDICPVVLNEKPLATGWDSLVYTLGSQVLKVYNRSKENDKVPPSDEMLILYWEITDKVNEVTLQENLTYIPPLTNKSYSIKINPITAMYKCKHCGFITSISPYIQGPNLIMEPRELDLEYLTEGLEELNTTLSKRLNVSGIRIIPINIKRDDNLLLVTDLCSDINNLRRR